jgi:oligoendopeptidase F
MNIPSLSSREAILPEYQKLLDLQVSTKQQLIDRITRKDQLDCQLGDDYAWRYIQQSCFTENEEFTKQFMHFVEKIMPEWQRMGDQLNNRLMSFPHLDDLEQPYHVYLRSVKNQIDLFREENIPLQEQDQKLATEYQACRAAMMVTYQGQEITFQQAWKWLECTDRDARKEVFDLMADRQLHDRQKTHELLDQMIDIRLQQAKNAWYASYINYIYAAKGRFDYTPNDVAQFRYAIKTAVTPLYIDQLRSRKEELGVEKLMPYDLGVDPSWLPPLHPFETAEELIQKTITGLTAIDTRFGERISKLNDQWLFDLASRKGKQPWGYNYPMLWQWVSFVFANVAGTMGDVETMLHECGHALHQRFMEHLPLGIFKEYPSEVAEVASMSMELFSYDMRDKFALNEEELIRAKKNHLEDIIKTLCRVAIVDEFQHWLYTNPWHTHTQREDARKTIFLSYSGDVIAWWDYNDLFGTIRQKQLHIFELPFYYIEYAIAQLGAIAMWKNYLTDKKQWIQNYTNFLSQWYTCTIPEIFQAWGIKFDFSEQYIKELLAVVREELARLV